VSEKKLDKKKRWVQWKKSDKRLVCVKKELLSAEEGDAACKGKKNHEKRGRWRGKKLYQKKGLSSSKEGKMRRPTGQRGGPRGRHPEETVRRGRK